MQTKRHSCGVVVVRETEHGLRYLLLRVYSYWDFPKGLMGPGETPLETACREVAEETGLTDLQFHWGHIFRETPPYNRGKIARYFLASTSQSHVHLPISPELGRPEHHEFRWVSYVEGLSLLSDRLRPVLEWAYQLTDCNAADINAMAQDVQTTLKPRD